jgi:hypothetical protein
MPQIRDENADAGIPGREEERDLNPRDVTQPIYA